MVVNENQGGAPNYYPNSFGGPETSPRARKLEPSFKVVGDVDRRDNGNEDNFTQPRILWKSVLDEPARNRLVDNIANHLVNAADFIQDRAIGNFAQVDSNFGKQLKQVLKTKQKHPQP